MRKGLQGKVKKFFIISTALAALGLLVGQADAGQILKVIDAAGNLGPFSSYPNTQNSYKTALEIYNPAVTATSSSTGVVALTFAPTEITGGEVEAPHTVTFRFTDGDATFAIAGINYVWVLVDRDNLGNILNVYAASSSGATGSEISLSSGNVDCDSNPSQTCDIPANTDLYLLQAAWADTDDDDLVDVGELSSATNVSANLKNKQADCNTFPVWPLAASISGANGNIGFPTVSFTYVTPQLEVRYPENNVLNAELNSDSDFATFVIGSGPYVNTDTDTEINPKPRTREGFFVINDLQAGESWNWIAWTTGPSIRIAFDLNTTISEPSVINVAFGNPATPVRCQETTQDRVWHCDSGSIVPPPDYDLILEVDGTTPNNPTLWTVSNLTITSATGMICYNNQPRTVGAWYGGVEAIVPFVKYDPAVGAQTYIVFYNRRDVDVPVYAKAMLQDSAPIVISTREPIATIPAHGQIKFTADQLQSLLPELAGYNMAQGVPIKFMFRVPSQSLINNINVTVNVDWMTDAITATGTLTNVNPLDPYIDGIVVSVYGSQQRSVPLKFKFFKQGSYNE
jgi:hypothetical protein